MHTLWHPKRWLLSVGALALVSTLALLSTPALAQRTTRDKAALPNIVLVHGAWADASSWRNVIERLQRDGYHVVAPQLRLVSLADDVAQVRQALTEQTGPTILVGHSYGGEVITQLGTDAPHVVALVYISAFAPDTGESLQSLSSEGPPAPGAAFIHPDAQGFLTIDPTAFPTVFAGDVKKAEAQVLAVVQKPLAESIFGTSIVGQPAWRSFPSWYLLTQQDEMIPPAAQHFMAQRMGATISSVNGSHASLISHADVVTDLIQRVALMATPHH